MDGWNWMELDGCLMLCFAWKLIINCTHWRNYAQLAGHFWSFLPPTCWREKTTTMWRFPKMGGTPKSFKSKDHFSIEIHGDLGLPYLRNPPCEPWHLPLSQPFCSASCRSSLPGIIDDTYQFDEYDEYGNHVVHDVVLDVGGVGWCLGGGADIYIYIYICMLVYYEQRIFVCTLYTLNRSE